MALDPSEVLILEHLQTNARLPNAKVAELTNISESSCWRKTRLLEESGIIRRYAAIVDPKKMGLNFEAVVQINLDRHDTEGVGAFVALLKQCKEVIECLSTTGDFDYLLRIVCQDIDAYNDFIENRLFPNKSIRSMRTNVVLRRIKSDAPISP